MSGRELWVGNQNLSPCPLMGEAQLGEAGAGPLKLGASGRVPLAQVPGLQGGWAGGAAVRLRGQAGGRGDAWARDDQGLKWGGMVGIGEGRSRSLKK